ncbi:MAG: hypothetical protein ACRBK7_01825 [Acidimicrobiales bacterium]
MLVTAAGPAVAEETATAIWLNVMHVVAAIPIVGMLSQAMRSSDAS